LFGYEFIGRLRLGIRKKLFSEKSGQALKWAVQGGGRIIVSGDV